MAEQVSRQRGDPAGDLVAAGLATVGGAGQHHRDGARGDLHQFRRQVGRLGHQAVHDLGPDLQELVADIPEHQEHVAAQIAGSVGLAGSANIGESASMFEAIHGSAPRRANQNLANPSGLLLGSVMMLVHIGQPDIAAKVHNAWLRTLEDGVHTYDIYKEGVSKEKVGTKEFAEAVIKRIGQNPQILKTADYSKANEPMKLGVTPKSSYKAKKELIGVDIFLDYSGGDPQKIGGDISKISSGNLALSLIENKGVKVYPNGQPVASHTDFWCCRFLTNDTKPCEYNNVHEVMGRISAAGYDVVKSENLSTFDGEKGFSSLN